ncbi:MAG: hypothetical protein MZU97_03385 [Bacillus subtilis]|nr:hypothetical protein [Bacillus subtilis]
MPDRAPIKRNKITYLYPESRSVSASRLSTRSSRAMRSSTERRDTSKLPHFNGAERAIVFDRNHKIVQASSSTSTS